MATLEVGLSASTAHVVGAADTARAVGSGALDVLGTPVVVAWCEAATCAAVVDALPDGATTVGTRVQVDHVAPSPVGAQVGVRATLTEVDGRRLVFEVEVTDADGASLATATVVRAVVDVERFVARLPTV